MNVADLFASLSVGELNGLSLALDGSGDIDDIQKSKVIHATNQALTALYTRFPHNTDYVKVEMQEGVQKYYLRTKYAVSNTDPENTAVRYILDTAEFPLDARISKILSVTDPDAKCFRDEDVAINAPGKDASVQMLGFDGFYVKNPVAGNIYTVELQCLHPLLNVTDPNDDEEIVLAPVLHEALNCRIAAKVYGGMGNEDASIKEVSYFTQYENICKRVEDDDTLQKSTSSDHDKLREGGWE